MFGRAANLSCHDKWISQFTRTIAVRKLGHYSCHLFTPIATPANTSTVENNAFKILVGQQCDSGYMYSLVKKSEEYKIECGKRI
jgi:hypothetical protein